MKFPDIAGTLASIGNLPSIQSATAGALALATGHGRRDPAPAVPNYVRPNYHTVLQMPELGLLLREVPSDIANAITPMHQQIANELASKVLGMHYQSWSELIDARIILIYIGWAIDKETSAKAEAFFDCEPLGLVQETAEIRADYIRHQYGKNIGLLLNGGYDGIVHKMLADKR